MHPTNQYPRNIFILTDGAVSNTSEVSRLIAKNSDSCRTYTIGIGNGCSRQLITEAAEAGKGKYEFIADNKDMNSKIIGLLQDSLTPFLTDIKLEYDKNLIELITPSPESIKYVRKNETLFFFILFNKGFEDSGQSSFKLSYVNNLKPDIQQEEIQIKNTDLTLKQDFLHKYGLFQMIKQISKSVSHERNYNKDIYLAKKMDIDGFCLKIALRFQILTTFTAFLCIIEEKDPNDHSIKILKKIEIPLIIDYSYDKKPYKNPPPAYNNPPGILNPLGYINPPVIPCGSLAIKETKGLAHLKRKTWHCSSFSNINNIWNNSIKNKKYLISSPIDKKENFIDASEEILMKIIQKQRIFGYWEENDEIFDLLKIKKDFFFKEIPKEIIDKKIWVTILVLSVLNEKFKGFELSWNLIFQKGVEYLEENKLIYLNYKKIIDKIINFM